MLLAATACLTAFADEPESRYIIREREASIGTNIPRVVGRSNTLPVNKPYAQLSAEEKASLAAQYESMGPGDEPPFPERGEIAIWQPLRDGLQSFDVAGELDLLATVGADGNVTQVQALKSPDPKFTKFAATVLMLTKFKPALCKGEPCRMDFRFRLTIRDHM